MDDSTAAVFEHQLPQIYQIKVFLRGSSPMIYRRLLVRSDMSLADLHYAIQLAMRWEGFHLHRFMIHGKTYGNEDANYIVRYDAPEKPTLKDFDFEQAERFLYEYDFISWWQHEVRVEKILPFDATKTYPYPVCNGGKRACPPEDCGGPWDYQELLHAGWNPFHNDHHAALQILGASFDPEQFHLGQVNVQLRQRFHPAPR